MGTALSCFPRVKDSSISFEPKALALELKRRLEVGSVEIEASLAQAGEKGLGTSFSHLQPGLSAAEECC